MLVLLSNLMFNIVEVYNLLQWVIVEGVILLDIYEVQLILYVYGLYMFLIWIVSDSVEVVYIVEQIGYLVVFKLCLFDILYKFEVQGVMFYLWIVSEV